MKGVGEDALLLVAEIASSLFLQSLQDRNFEFRQLQVSFLCSLTAPACEKRMGKVLLHKQDECFRRIKSAHITTTLSVLKNYPVFEVSDLLYLIVPLPLRGPSRPTGYPLSRVSQAAAWHTHRCGQREAQSSPGFPEA